jgi:hypothetical protein
MQSDGLCLMIAMIGNLQRLTTFLFLCCYFYLVGRCMEYNAEQFTKLEDAEWIVTKLNSKCTMHDA